MISRLVVVAASISSNYVDEQAMVDIGNKDSSQSRSAYSHVAVDPVREDFTKVDDTVSDAGIHMFYAGLRLFNNGRYDIALEVFARAVKIAPTLGDAHALMAVCLRKLGRTMQAECEFALADEYGSSYKLLEYERGTCAYARRSFETAALHFRKFLQEKPRPEEATNARTALAIVENNFLVPASGDYLARSSINRLPHWNHLNKPLLVYIDGKMSASEEYKKLLKKSFQQWTEPPSRVRFVFTECSKKAQIKCSWTDDPNFASTQEKLGWTRLYQRNGVIYSAVIKLLNIKNNGSLTRTEMLAQAQSVDLHEIGHALGLQHSDQAFDSMYRIISPIGLEFALTQRDLRTVAALCSLYEHRVSPGEIRLSQ